MDFTDLERVEYKAELIALVASVLENLKIENKTETSKAKAFSKTTLVLIVKLNITDGKDEIKAAKALKQEIDRTFNLDPLRCATEINPSLSSTRAKK